MHQNTQFHIEKQKSSIPPPTPSPPRSLRSLAGGFQEIWNAPCGISVYAPWCSLSLSSLFSQMSRCAMLWFFTILRHLSSSSAALTTSCSVIPVELLMSLSHDVGGRPLFLFLLPFPVMIVLASPFLRITYMSKETQLSPSYHETWCIHLHIINACMLFIQPVQYRSILIKPSICTELEKN